MPNAEVIRAQTTPEDGALFETGLRNSKFIPQHHICFTDDIRQKMVTEISQKNTGQEIIFPFEKESTLVEDVDVYFTPAPLALPAGATYIRYVDWLGVAIARLFEWRYGSNTIASYRNEVIFSDIQYLCDEKKFNETHMLFGDLSAAQRNTYALAPTPVRVKVPSPWRGMRSHSVLIAGLANKPNLHIFLNDASRIVQTDGTKPAVLQYSNIHCDRQSIHTTGSLRGEYTGLTLTPQGINYLVTDVLTFDYSIPANSLGANSDTTIELRDLDGPIWMISFLLRTAAQLDPTNADVGPFEIDTTYLEGLLTNVKSNSMDLTDPEYQELDGVYKINKFFDSRYATRQGTFLWAEFPTRKNTASGSLSFGNFTNPRLLLRSNTLNNVHPELVLTVIARRHNWTVQQRGNYQTVWR